jgi:DNA mismatch repair protein MutS2
MDLHSLNKLEYFKIIEILKGYTYTSMGRDLISNLLPSNDPQVIEKSLTEVEEAKRFLENEGNLPFSSFEEIDDVLKKAKVRSILNGKELNRLKIDLILFNEIKDEIERKKEKYLNLFNLAKRLKRIQRFFMK